VLSYGDTLRVKPLQQSADRGTLIHSTACPEADEIVLRERPGEFAILGRVRWEGGGGVTEAVRRKAEWSGRCARSLFILGALLLTSVSAATRAQVKEVPETVWEKTCLRAAESVEKNPSTMELVSIRSAPADKDVPELVGAAYDAANRYGTPERRTVLCRPTADGQAFESVHVQGRPLSESDLGLVNAILELAHAGN